MDAVKFLKTKNRMCKTNVICKNCPLDAYKSECDTVDVEDFKLIKIVSIVEQWSKEHPRKTYMDDFLEKFPDVKSFDDDVPMVHWCDIYNKGNCKYGQGDGLRMCVECWGEEMNEDE